MHHFRFAMLLCVLLIAGCETITAKIPGLRASTPSETALSEGIKDYEEASYPEAEKHFLKAQELRLESKSSQIKAYKYLAFIHCTTSREKLCRSEFRKVLELDPHYDLEAAEAGHPLWGPVFRSVKTEMASAAKKK
jgi:Tfp pilus assembly protein PilF